MQTTDVADLLNGLDLFSGFSYGELKIIARFLSHETRQADEIIFHEGDPGSFMLILVEGRISVYKGGENGNHLLAYEGRGRFIGEMALLDNEPRSATCKAETTCSMLILNHQSLARLANEAPLLAYRFMRCLALLLSRRLRKTSGMLVEYLAG